MREINKRKIEREVKEIQISCSGCGTKAKKDGSWGENNFQVEEVTIEYKSGQRYPEFGNGVKKIVDLCPKCFEKILIPFLESKGIQIEEEEWEW